jgi:predicted enzyme related to lactoylglutathione lyase
MSIYIGDISIDCANPERTREFYAALTGWERRTMYNCPALIADNGLVILFMGCDIDYIPPTWPEEPGRQQKQMHFDLGVEDLPAAVEKALQLGATKGDEQYNSENLVVLLDPEGHPFCLTQRQSSKSEFDLYYERKGYGAIPNVSINVDCPDTKKLRAFYAELTDWDRDFHWTALVAENKMVVHFMQSDFDYIPPVWPEEPGKQHKQMHFNFGVENLASSVELALKLGATKPKTQYGRDDYVTLLDPVGHPFCLCKSSVS